jgi:4-amino-4-deoxy-L-arabinose transferase-like glycosyltransferase
MQGDMLENYVWGIEWQAGYAKHPPLFAWMTAAWFWFFPHTHIVYFALSSLNAMGGLLGIVALAGRFLTPRLAVIAGLAMAISPLYSTLAMKFNANAILLLVWPWVAYFFVRFMQTGKGWTSLALGVLAGAAMLGKYFSIVLLIALCIATIVRPKWRSRLYNWRILLALIAAILVLTPHIRWLILADFPILSYIQARADDRLQAACIQFGVYTLAQFIYLVPSAGFVLFCVLPPRQQAAKRMLMNVVRPAGCADLWWLAFAPLMLVGLLAVLTKTEMASVWGMAAWFAIAPLWLIALERDGIALVEKQAVRFFIGYWLIVLITAASMGYMAVLRHKNDATEPRAELAIRAQALWQQHTGKSTIPIVAGSDQEAKAIAFYGGRPTRFWDMHNPRATPWLAAADLKHQGAVLVCRSSDATCLAASAAFAGTQPTSVAVHKHAWGKTLPAHHYQLFFMRPDVSTAFPPRPAISESY